MRRLRPAVEIVSDIGSKAFDLQHHEEAEIRKAVKLLRDVNGPMFDWLVDMLGVGATDSAVVTQGADHHDTSTRV